MNGSEQEVADLHDLPWIVSIRHWDESAFTAISEYIGLFCEAGP